MSLGGEKKKMGKIISEEVWNLGKGLEGNLEKEVKILEVLEEKRGMDIKEVIKLSGIKWVYSSLKNLEKLNKVERKKLGKSMYYRKVKVK